MTDTANTSPELDLWSCIRRDFLAGEPASSLAERYAVTERTIRRQAAMHGWRRCDRVPSDDDVIRTMRRRSLDDVVTEYPSLAPLVELNTEDMAELLLHPDPKYLRHFAFRRAAEEAVLDHPARCLAWMRVVEAMNRSGDRITREDKHFSPADRIRAMFIEANPGWSDPSDEDDPTHDDGPSAG